MSQTDLTIAGVGGQGSILAGVILGSAAVTYDNKYATQTQAYSSELRGGFAAAWVIVSDEPVEFPRVTQPDVLVAQAQDSISRFAVTANMVMLGALCNVTQVVSRTALEQAIIRAVPRGKDQINLKAFELGFEQVKNT
jgi:2-oxoglutarate ferredoxin oxidoreductase subunit gamma